VGIHKRVLQDGRFGLIPTEPHAAMWSGTIQSFMQEPVHPAADNHILRSDECRLLYLARRSIILTGLCVNGNWLVPPLLKSLKLTSGCMQTVLSMVLNLQASSGLAEMKG
jgi:hypothetical protein